MSKANQAFNQNDEAVSPVIGVILMVAITVVLAAVVFVLVSNLGSQQEQSENASATATSPSAGVIEIALVREGDRAPYVNTPTTDPSYYSVTVNGVLCATTNTLASWSAGGVIRLVSGGADCDAATVFAAGTPDVSVVVSVAGTTILSTSVDVQN